MTITLARRRELLAAARQASDKAYAPYSGLRVGAALLSRAGDIFVGANVENASFGLTLCAERAAVAAAVAAGAREFVALAIAAHSPVPLSPCGACRQVLAEFGRDLLILSAGTKGRPRAWRLKDLLPQAFTYDRPPGRS